MPQQRKLDEFFSGSPVKSTKAKRKGKTRVKESPPSEVISIDESESDWDAQRSKLAPSSPVTLQNEHGASESDEAPVELSPVAKRSRLQAAGRVVSDVETSGSDDYVPLNIAKKRKTAIVDDSEDGKVHRPTKRRKTLIKGLKPTKDDENLMDDLDSDVVLKSRLRAPTKKSAYTKALEKLKRERHKLPSEPSEESSSEAESEDARSPKFKPIPGAQRPVGSRASNSENDSRSSNSDTSDFVVEDDGNVEVVLPAAYSSQKMQPLSHSFKVFFQFLVHIACQPPRLRALHMKARLEGDKPEAEYWRNAVDQLRRKLDTIRDSQVASTIWKLDFRTALETMPELTISIIAMEPFCHACRRNAACSTRQATLEGEAYNKVGFGPLDSSSDESDSDQDDDDSSESVGDILSPVSETLNAFKSEATFKVFNLGQHCARRVELFHAFAHWEYHLFKAIEEEIIALETTNRERLGKKKKKKTLVRTSDPDSIVELLEKRKVIEMHWKEIENMIYRARNVEMRQRGDID